MVDFYVMRIKDGQNSLDKVPKLWRDDVAKKLKEQEYDIVI